MASAFRLNPPFPHPIFTVLHATSFSVSGVGPSAAAGEAIFWIAVLSCVVAEIAILRAVFRVRGTVPGPAAPGVGSSLPRVRRGVEILWALLPALALALVLVLTWRAMRAGHASPSPAPRATSHAASTGVPG
jgi:heme/copper-type cytochrome/quinol oxidase subunit 2